MHRVCVIMFTVWGLCKVMILWIQKKRIILSTLVIVCSYKTIFVRVHTSHGFIQVICEICSPPFQNSIFLQVNNISSREMSKKYLSNMDIVSIAHLGVDMWRGLFLFVSFNHGDIEMLYGTIDLRHQKSVCIDQIIFCHQLNVKPLIEQVLPTGLLRINFRASKYDNSPTFCSVAILAVHHTTIIIKRISIAVFRSMKRVFVNGAIHGNIEAVQMNAKSSNEDIKLHWKHGTSARSGVFTTSDPVFGVNIYFVIASAAELYGELNHWKCRSFQRTEMRKE